MSAGLNKGSSSPGRDPLVSGDTGTNRRSCGSAGAVANVLRVRGDPADAGLIEPLERGFAERSGVVFANAFAGPESALAGIYTKTADIAFMPREIREPMERMAFQWALLERPFEIAIANSAIDHASASAQLGVYVHRSNPLSSLSLADLDGIFGAEHLRANGNVRTWDQLGLGGDWTGRSIVPLMPSVDSVAALFFRRLVMRDSRKWNPVLRQLTGGAALEFLGNDPTAIVIAPAYLRSGQVRRIAISRAAGGPSVSLAPQSVIDRSYPLVRARTVVVHRAKGQPLRPELNRFLKFILSEEGQAIVSSTGLALPLDGRTASAERAKLQ